MGRREQGSNCRVCSCAPDREVSADLEDGMADETRAQGARPAHWRTPEEKLRLVLGSYQVDNVAEYCRVEGIDRTYLYDLRRELEAGAKDTWAERRPGRPPSVGDDDDAEQLKQDLERTRKELELAREEAAKWEVRAKVEALYVRAYQEAAAKKKSKRRKGST